MAAIDYTKLFEPAALTTSDALYYTVPNGKTLRNGMARLTNVTAGAVTTELYAVPSGGTSSDANAIIKGYSINANSFLDVELPIMKAGDELRGLAGAATSITMHYLDGALFS